MSEEYQVQDTLEANSIHELNKRDPKLLSTECEPNQFASVIFQTNENQTEPNKNKTQLPKFLGDGRGPGCRVFPAAEQLNNTLARS